MGHPTTRYLVILPSLLALSACGQGLAAECQRDSDCSEGRCDEQGQCNIDPGPDGSEADDASPGEGDGSMSACGGTIDDVITRIELPMAPGRSANFRIATDATYSTAGQELDGQRYWNLDVNLANDSDSLLELGHPSGTWYEDEFPGASYTARLSQSSDLIGVFALHDDGLYLLGVVSPEDGLARTRLTYDPPALLMPVPLELDDTWETSSVVSGVAQGAFVSYSEVYRGSTDARGAVKTPYGEFRVLRTRTELTRTVGFVTTVVRQFNFVSECTGIIASIISENDEEDIEFDSAAEIRRLIP